MNTLFNYLNKNDILWMKDLNKLKFNKKDIIDKKKLRIKSSSNNDFAYKEFILLNSKLLWLNNKEIKGYINLNFIGIDIISKELKITLFTNSKYFNIYFEEIYIFKKWKKILMKKCVQNYFLKKFEIISKIGEGNNSAVYRVKKLKNKKDYAVKIILKKYLKEDNDIKMFINEINILKSLNHKNIISLKHIYEGKNSFYLFMDYCNCKSLNYYIKNDFKSKEKLLLIIQIINALSYIHSLGLVHRDLKPENIFLHKNEKNEMIVKLGDFGLSNYLNQEFILKRCGTPGYISPEILNYKKEMDYKISSDVDIYSLGHIIYNIITSDYIFEFKSIEELLLLNKNNKFKLKNINIKINSLIERCLEVNPNNRIKINELKYYFDNLLSN